jgi:ATPase family associated with various cellular activities (AAA)
MSRTKIAPAQTRRQINDTFKAAVVAKNLSKGKTAKEIFAEIDKRIRSRFEVMADFTHAAINGLCRAMIVSGPPGLGKSFEIERALTKHFGKTKEGEKQHFIIVKGYVLTTGLIRTLWEYKDENCVIVFDDADTIFWDENSMNLLKTVCDTTEDRVVSYLSEYEMEDEAGEKIPKRFAFNGSVIFLTNINFDDAIENGTKIAPHLMALVSRAHYIDLTMYSNDDYMVRIQQVIDDGMLKEMETDKRNEVLGFIHKHKDNLREVSLRMVIKVANIRKMERSNWQDIAMITCCRNIRPVTIAADERKAA